jgi:hypothetical protein
MMLFSALEMNSLCAALVQEENARVTNCLRLSGCAVGGGAPPAGAVGRPRPALRAGGPLAIGAAMAVNLDLLGFFCWMARAIDAGEGTGAGGGGTAGGAMAVAYVLPHGAEIGLDIPEMAALGCATTLA